MRGEGFQGETLSPALSQVGRGGKRLRLLLMNLFLMVICASPYLPIGGIVDRGVMIGAGAVILLVVFLGNLVIDITEVIGASS
jgi:hypothetical protein